VRGEALLILGNVAIINLKNKKMEIIAVIGAGTMGNGIAHVFIQKGFKVHLIDTQAAALEKAVSTIEKNMDRQISKGVITQELKKVFLQKLTNTQNQLLLSQAILPLFQLLN
jgi:3-hydroxyacyl-CoA dehydrogenase